MTIQECYAAIGGDYNDVASRLRTDERIAKFLFGGKKPCRSVPRRAYIKGHLHEFVSYKAQYVGRGYH